MREPPFRKPGTVATGWSFKARTPQAISLFASLSAPAGAERLANKLMPQAPGRYRSRYRTGAPCFPPHILVCLSYRYEYEGDSEAQGAPAENESSIPSCVCVSLQRHLLRNDPSLIPVGFFFWL